MDKEEFCQKDPNVQILEEESSKIEQHMQQVVDLSFSFCRVSGWTVEPKESISKSGNINRSSQTRDKESNRFTSSWRSHSPFSCKIQDQPGPESEFLHFEDWSDYMEFYRKEKLKRQEFALKESIEKAKRHNRKNNKISFSSHCNKCIKHGDKNVSRVQTNSEKPLTSISSAGRGYSEADRKDVPLMLIISSHKVEGRPRFQTSNLPLTGHLIGRRLQNRPSDQPVRKFKGYREQNCIKNDNENALGVTGCDKDYSCNSKRAEKVRAQSNAVKHSGISPQTAAKLQLHFQKTVKPAPPKSRPSAGRTVRSSSAPQLHICTTSMQGLQLGKATEVSNKGWMSIIQGPGTSTIDYSQYTHMFKNVLDYYGQRKLQSDKTNETQLQQQTLLIVKS